MNILNYYNFSITNKEKYYLFRYFPSLNKLKSFLTDGIYLGPADKFSDNLECATKHILTQINRISGFEELTYDHNPHLTANELDNIKLEFHTKMKELANELTLSQRRYFISCWYIEESIFENELMWRSYGSNRDDRGFLVRINLKDFLEELEQSLAESENEQLRKLIIGPVQYFDLSKNENIRELKYAGFRKHISFKGENEFRLLIKKVSINDFTKPIYIKLQKSFYDDIIIFCHPNTDHHEYVKLRNEIRDFDVDLNVSKMNIWYKLKTYSKAD